MSSMTRQAQEMLPCNYTLFCSCILHVHCITYGYINASSYCSSCVIDVSSKQKLMGCDFSLFY